MRQDERDNDKNGKAATAAKLQSGHCGQIKIASAINVRAIIAIYCIQYQHTFSTKICCFKEKSTEIANASVLYVTRCIKIPHVEIIIEHL